MLLGALVNSEWECDDTQLSLFNRAKMGSIKTRLTAPQLLFTPGLFPHGFTTPDFLLYKLTDTLDHAEKPLVIIAHELSAGLRGSFPPVIVQRRLSEAICSCLLWLCTSLGRHSLTLQGSH